MTLGLFVATSWALPHLTAIAAEGKPGSHPSFIFTNSGLWDHPIADLASLSMQKASQYNLLLSYKQMMEPQGVHVGGVNVSGTVSEEEPVRNPTNIAKAIFDLSQQDRPNWQWDVKVGDWDEFMRQMMAAQGAGGQ